MVSVKRAFRIRHIISPELVHDYLVDYLSQPEVALPPGMELGLNILRTSYYDTP